MRKALTLVTCSSYKYHGDAGNFGELQKDTAAADALNLELVAPTGKLSLRFNWKYVLNKGK